MRIWVASVAAAAVLAGCTAKRPVGDVQLSPSVQIEVANNYTPPEQFTVYIYTQSGARQTLGDVSPGQRGRFTYRPTNAGDQFALRAQNASGRTMTSQQFTLVNATSLLWSLDNNTMQIFEQ